MSLLLAFFRRLKTVTLTAISAWAGQEAHPASDVTDGSWVTETGATTLAASILEVTTNDADYIRSAAASAAAEVLLGSITSPQTGTVSFFVRAKGISQPAPMFPLNVSSDGRSIIRPTGAVFRINGEAGWSVATNLTQANVTTYLTDRAARGVNTILFSFIEFKFTDQSPLYKNKNGDIPFSGTISTYPDFTTPVEAYWQNVDWVVNAINSFGMVALVTPCYLGFQMGTEGWAEAVWANGTANMTTYGTFLGNRYKNYPNIIWVMGGDSGPNFTHDLTTHVNNLATAIKAADPVHLITAHSAPDTSAYDSYNQSWLDLNTSYSSLVTTIHSKTRLARQQATKPVFLIESVYGNATSPTPTDLDLRTEMYQGMLGGGVGHVYGQNPMWYFGVNSSASGNAFAATGGQDWHSTLASYGSTFLLYARRLETARALDTLTPDYAHTVVTAGYDTGGAEGVTYCPVMANSQMLVAYLRAGSGSALTVAKSQFVTATFNINWYNVRTGATTNGGTSAFGSGTQVFTAPDTNDWVLLLDDQALAQVNP